MSKKCQIYYFSDMQRCVECGLSWDANDPHPPRCLLDKPAKVSFIDKLIARIFVDKNKH